MHTPAREPQKYFPQTSWTLLVAVQGEGSTAYDALEEFTRRYYRPVYAYLAAIVRDGDEAEEMVQGFFATVVLSGRLLTQLQRTRGSFRPYLKQALRNYVIDELRKRERQKRRVPAEELRPDGWPGGWERLALATAPAPDAAFHAAWVRALLEEAIARVRTICEGKGQTAHLALFLGRYLSASSAPPSWEHLGADYGVDGKTARNRAETVVRHFQLVLREMLIDEVGSAQSADAEIATLLAFL